MMQRKAILSMANPEPQQAHRVLCLSNVFDHHYIEARGEEIDLSLSAGKRRDLFHCLELATGREIIILSTPPKAARRRIGRWLFGAETRFGSFRQLFAPNWDIPKLRIPCSWFFYAVHVLRHSRNGDLILIDNYEIVYVIAAWFVRFSRNVHFVLDYEDGKYLIDSGFSFLLTRLAEMMGRPLMKAALVAAAPLRNRLPASIPVELVPGFYSPSPGSSNRLRARNSDVRFLYSGSLDRTRGVDLLLAALDLLPAFGWQLNITGSGDLEASVSEASHKWGNRVVFHRTLGPDQYRQVISESDVGLNCQRIADPISEVTFPSKIFTYLSAGLSVISSRASDVPAICGEACLYYDEDTPASLAMIMSDIVAKYQNLEQSSPRLDRVSNYTVEGTSRRLRDLLKKAGIV